jgi:hypothetical protein
MGLFDKVIKKGLNDALGGALGDKVTGALEQATGLDINGDGRVSGSGNAYGAPPQGATMPATVPGQQEAYRQVSQGGAVRQPASFITDKPYFREILTSEFGGYILREDVPVSELGGEGKTYDFALFARGECAAVITLVAHNRYNNRAYKGSKAAAQAAGVPFINFFTHMGNERDYVINRISSLAKPLV